MRDASNIEELARLQLDYIGFIFYEKSKRYVGEDFDLNRLKTIPTATKKVGVFVNASLEYVQEKISNYQLDVVQLHGEESPDFCKELSKQKVQIIKVFPVGNHFDFSQLLPYGECVDFFLFDTKGKERGGNGITFNWEILEEYKMETPFFLSGGIGPESLEKIKQFDHQKCVALDVNSGFESAPGIKKIQAIKTFQLALRNRLEEKQNK